MNDLVNMAVNLKVSNGSSAKETLKNPKSNIDTGNKKNVDNNFKKVLHKVNENADMKNNKVSTEEQIKNEKVDKKLKESSSKPAKAKNDSLDLLLMLLLQHLGDEKVDMKKIMEELNKGDSNIEDTTNEVMKLIGKGDMDNLNSDNELQKSVDDIISALLNESKEDTKLNDFLTKIKIINKDENKFNVKDLLEQDSFMKERILNTIKDKLNQTNSINNDLNIIDGIHSSDSIKLLTQIENSNSDSSAEYNKDSKEEEFLKGLTSNKSKLESKVDRVTNFMNDFSKVNNEALVNNAEIEAPIAINKNNLVNDFIKQVKYMEQNNVKEMTVKVKPQELGEVVIRLTVENGIMKANITANNKEAYNLLNSKLQDLNNSLGNGEIKIQNFTIDIYNGDTTFFSRENSKEQRNSSSSNNKGKNNGVLSVDDVVNSNDELKNELEDSNVNAFV
ncbi:flagellar hook-length control protein FliK [Clostridium botulinum]|nr:flagellar hook-length control protein FliK [Clostridium botulinum]